MKNTYLQILDAQGLTNQLVKEGKYVPLLRKLWTSVKCDSLQGNRVMYRCGFKIRDLNETAPIVDTS